MADQGLDSPDKEEDAEDLEWSLDSATGKIVHSATGLSALVRKKTTDAADEVADHLAQPNNPQVTGTLT